MCETHPTETQTCMPLRAQHWTKNLLMNPMNCHCPAYPGLLHAWKVRTLDSLDLEIKAYIGRHKCLEGPSQQWQRLHGCLGPEGNAASLIACMHPCVKVIIYMRIDFDRRNSSLRGVHALECKGCFFAMRAKRKINFFTTLVCNLCLVPQSDGKFALGLRRYMYVTSCTYTHTTPKWHVDSREAVNFLALWQRQRKELKHSLFNHPLARTCPKLFDSKSDDQLVSADVTSAKGKPSVHTLMRELHACAMHVPYACKWPLPRFLRQITHKLCLAPRALSSSRLAQVVASTDACSKNAISDPTRNACIKPAKCCKKRH